MTPSYDKLADALYVRASSRAIARQVEMSDGVVVDVDAAGNLVGIEVLSPGAGWRWRDIAERFHLDNDDEAYLRSIAIVPWGSAALIAGRPGGGGQQAKPVPAGSLVA